PVESAQQTAALASQHVKPPRSTVFPYTTLFRSADTQHTPPGLPDFGPTGDFLGIVGEEIVRPLVELGGRHVQGLKIKGLDIPLRSEEHTSELQSREKLVCRLLLEKKNRLIKSAI